MKSHLAWVMCCAVGFVGSVSADTLLVPTEYPKIQAAIDAASDGDEVVVSPGEYFESIDFLGKAITVRSTDPSDPAIVEATIINANGLSRVVVCTNDEGPDTVLEGVVVTGGFTRNGGAGLFVSSDACPTVRKCVFQDNHAVGSGGGVFGSGLMITDCTFRNNTSCNRGGGYAGESATIRRCLFVENLADLGGGASFSGYSSPVVIDTTFINNSATEEGGAVWSFESLPLTIIGSRFVGNTAVEYGGAIIIHDDGFVYDSVIAGNSAGLQGGGFHGGFSFTTMLAGCTITSNVSGAGGGIYAARAIMSNAANCVVTGNVPDQVDGPVTQDPYPVSYSLVEGGYPGVGNIDADPMFVDPDGPDNDPLTFEDNDYRLAAGSPAIDAGDNGAVPPDAADIDGDGDFQEPLPLDLDGNPRFVDDPDTPDTGLGEPPIVDMGAYEFQACLPDFNGDGTVGTVDLLALLSRWGTPDADLTGDGDTGIQDLLVLIAAWGACQ